MQDIKPIQQRAIQTRQAILAAARTEFSLKGFHGARVDAIAAEAGVNKQRLYANFKNKAGLFTAVLKAVFIDLAREENQLLKLSVPDIPRLAELILDCYVSLHTRHPEFWRLLAWENLEGGRHSSGLAGLKDPVLTHLRRLYERGQKSGHFLKNVPFEGFIFNLLAVSYFMVSNRHTLKQSTGLDCSRPAVRKTLCKAVVRQLRAKTTNRKGLP
jgi:AcrR family transcriptional regulator